MPEEIETKPEEIIEEIPKVRFLEKLKIHKFKILGGVLGVLVFAGVVFGAYKLGQRQILPRPTPTPGRIELTQCEEDNDCLLAIRLDQCCDCPEAVSREAVQGDENLVEYEFGKDYSKEIKVDCQGVVCAPCVFWNKAVCEAGKCKAVFEEVRVDCRRLEALEMEGLKRTSQDDCQICGGKWEPLSMNLNLTGCNPKTSDVGKTCTDETQCIGVCEAEEITSTSGTCSDYKYKLGYNFEFFEDKLVEFYRD